MIKQLTHALAHYHPVQADIHTPSTIKLTQRLTASLVDWLMSVLYILVVTLILMVCYYITGQGKWQTSSLHIIGQITITLPLYIALTYMDYAHSGTIGKFFAHLCVAYRQVNWKKSAIRNLPKGIIIALGVVAGTQIVNGGSKFEAVAILLLALVIALSQILMVRYRLDQRHIGDILAQTQVQKRAGN